MIDYFNLHRWTDRIPDAELRCMIRNIGHIAGRGKWSVSSLQGLVSYAFGIGSTHAVSLCERVKLDPHAPVKKALKVDKSAHP